MPLHPLWYLTVSTLFACDGLVQVEAAAKEMAKEVAVGLEEGASLVARAEKGLEVSLLLH